MKKDAPETGARSARLHNRLFWKILFGFWLTFLAASEGVWIFASLYQDHAQVAQAQRSMRIESARSAIAYGGIPALRALTTHWTVQEQADLHVVVDEGAHPPPGTDQSSPVVAPDGTHYLVYYHSPPPPPLHTWLHLPRELVVLGVLGGLVYSTLLATYLTWPLRRLRQGIARFAGGDLSVRVRPTMRQRHDEIADLAGDFDRMTERIEHLVTAREQLLHDVSHELRSPLARLAVATDLLRRDPLRGQGALDHIEREVHRLDRLVDEILTLSLAESGMPPMDEYVDVIGLVEAITHDVGFEAAARHVSVVAEIDGATRGGDSLTIKGSIELLRRMLENVVRNAVRFSPTLGRVIVRVRSGADGALELSVTDQGPGVPASSLQQIFDPFVRVDGANSRSGHGLGLSIAQRAAIAHGGSIEASNQRPQGLCVTIVLPSMRK